MLLSNKFKLPGIILILAGAGLTVLYFGFDFRFEMPVLAVFSSFTETRFFTTFGTNFADELIILLYLAGFSFIIFSKEKTETELIKKIRSQALMKTILTEIFLYFFVTLFIYGGGFIAFVIMNLFLPYIIYIVIFNVMKYKASKV